MGELAEEPGGGVRYLVDMSTAPRTGRAPKNVMWGKARYVFRFLKRQRADCYLAGHRDKTARRQDRCVSYEGRKTFE